MLVIPSRQVAAQTLDPTFVATDLRQTITVNPYFTRAMLPQPDGKIIVGGEYDFVDGVLTSRVRRLSSDGSPDGSFNPAGAGAPYGLPQALALQADGKILVGGYQLDGYNGTVSKDLVRLNPNGTTDATFNAGNRGFSSSDGYGWVIANQGVRSLAVQPDGKILVGGTFGSYNGLTEGNLMRLNPDGSRDLTFVTGNGIRTGAAAGRVDALLVQADGKILVGGSFDSYNSQPVGNIVRLNPDGTRDTGFALQSVGTGPTEQVRTLAQQPDGKLLIGGLFSQANGQASPNLLRLDLTGTRDNTFSPGTAAQNAVIYRIRLQPDGSMLVMGSFTQFNGTVRGGLAKLSSTGVLDAAFNTAGPGANALVYDALPAAGGQLLVGGTFTTFNGTSRTGLARLNQPSGSVDPAYNPVLDFRGSVYSAQALASGQIVVAGTFDHFNGQPVATNVMHLLNSDGTYNSVFAPGVASYNYILPDGRIYASVINASNSTATLARYLPTGAVDTTFSPVTVTLDPTQPYPRLTTRLTTTGELLLTGSFSRVNGVVRNWLAKISATGVLNSAFNPVGAWQPATINGIFDAWPLATGGVYVCWGDNVRSYLVRLLATGAPDNTFAIGSGPYAGPNASANYFNVAAVQPNGQPFVLGDFISFSGQPAFSLVRLTTTGTPDPTFNAAFPVAFGTPLLQPDGRLLVQQNAATLNTQLRRLNSDGSIDTSFPALPIPGSVHGVGGTTVLQPDGKILIYGNFTRINGQPRIGLARLTNTLLATRPAYAASPELNVFPNPARQQVTLRLPLSAASATAQPVDLLDIQGRLVRRFTLLPRQTEATLALDQVAAGVYLLQASTSQGPVRQRVVVIN
jgi:uncharacterized delta-60 repeat protein